MALHIGHRTNLSLLREFEDQNSRFSSSMPHNGYDGSEISGG
jgi:hypothetical protein